jgi:aspartyl-tRNA(Asn)/glutamyl-tRNA(Gln) amidotransferase subunit A
MAENFVIENLVETPKTLAELRAGVVEGRVKAADLAREYYERIEKKNPLLNVYLSLTKERALAQAERVDTRRRAIRCRRWPGCLWASRTCW